MKILSTLYNKTHRAITNHHGSVYIEFLVGFFCIMMCIAFAFAVLPIFSTRAKLDDAADKLLRTAELSGHTNLTTLTSELQDESEIAFTVDWSDTDYIVGTDHVQLGDDIKLTLTAQAPMEFKPLNIIHVITLNATAYGTSEVYRK